MQITMKSHILVTLGAPNSPEGALSIISKTRLDYCKEIFQKGELILCTGGWGPQFNTAEKPHAEYCKAYLFNKGLSQDDFTEIALSKNTVDDAVKIKAILADFEQVKLTIITSKFHVARVKLIFNEILADYQMHFRDVTSGLKKTELATLEKHEHQAIAKIKQNGLYY